MTTLNKKSNSLVFKTSKTLGKETIYVTIKLNDECKNGHQDFSITGDVYKSHLPKTYRNLISGGCIHDEIEKHFPEFKLFINLHLSDFKGIPMYAVENGFYHLRRMKDKEFCEYYRMSLEQFKILKTYNNKLEYALNLQCLGILDQWEKEAKEGIRILEELTGIEFLNDSKRNNLPNID